MMYLLYTLIALSIAAFDQFFKFWIIANVPIDGHRDLIPGVVSLTHIHNTGAAFSIFANMRMFLLVITFISLVVIIVYMAKAKLTKLGRIALSMILGGAIGNAIDRIVNGYVVDMFDLDFMEYAIFNVADCFIVVGGIIFCVYFIVDAIREEKLKKGANDSGYDEYDDEYDDEYGDEYDTHEYKRDNLDDTKIVDLSNSKYGAAVSERPKPIRVTATNAQPVKPAPVNYEQEFQPDAEFLSAFEPENKNTVFSKPEEPIAQIHEIKRVKPDNKAESDVSPASVEIEKEDGEYSSIKLPDYDMPVFKAHNSANKKTAQKAKKRRSSHVKVTPFYNDNDEMSFTQKLDFEFNKLLENNKDDGNNKN